jgi:hypothetical protein
MRTESEQMQHPRLRKEDNPAFVFNKARKPIPAQSTTDKGDEMQRMQRNAT